MVIGAILHDNIREYGDLRSFVRGLMIAVQSVMIE